MDEPGARLDPRLEPYRRRIGRLHDDHGAVGHLVTRVCTHWETVGPHSFPSYVNPEERLQWRVHFDDPERADAFSDDGDQDTTVIRGRETDTWEDGRLEIVGRSLRIEWLDGDDAAVAWRTNGW